MILKEKNPETTEVYDNIKLKLGEQMEPVSCYKSNIKHTPAKIL